MKGRALGDGIAIGPAHLHDPVVVAAEFFSSDSAAEARRLEAALNSLRTQVDAMLVQNMSPLAGETRDILETYRQLAHDPSWAARLLEAVKTGLSVEAAVDRARREHRARLESATDAYLRERLHDLEDLDNRLLRQLAGRDHSFRGAHLDGAILIARRLGPADLLEYRNAGLKALLLEEAGAGAHSVIVARALRPAGNRRSVTPDDQRGGRQYGGCRC